jgi:hypothetical protein
MTHRLLFFFKAIKGGRSLKKLNNNNNNNNKVQTRVPLPFSRGLGTLNLPDPRN